jgi:uncharacterized coiled-coil DUF342 family protein
MDKVIQKTKDITETISEFSTLKKLILDQEMRAKKKKDGVSGYCWQLKKDYKQLSSTACTFQEGFPFHVLNQF